MIKSRMEKQWVPMKCGSFASFQGSQQDEKLLLYCWQWYGNARASVCDYYDSQAACTKSNGRRLFVLPTARVGMVSFFRVALHMLILICPKENKQGARTVWWSHSKRKSCTLLSSVNRAHTNYLTVSVRKPHTLMFCKLHQSRQLKILLPTLLTWRLLVADPLVPEVLVCYRLCWLFTLLNWIAMLLRLIGVRNTADSLIEVCRFCPCLRYARLCSVHRYRLTPPQTHQYLTVHANSPM